MCKGREAPDHLLSQVEGTCSPTHFSNSDTKESYIGYNLISLLTFFFFNKDEIELC